MTKPSHWKRPSKPTSARAHSEPTGFLAMKGTSMIAQTTTTVEETTAKYVAVNMSFDARTDKVECTANKDMTIQGVNGAVVSLKKGEKFTAVRAGSLGPDMWYIVRHVSGEKKCTCPSRKPCKHEIAVQTGKPVVEGVKVPAAKTEAPKPQIAAPKFVSTIERAATAQMMDAPLNGQRGFALMK